MLWKASRIIKYACIGLLLIALFLPLSRCATRADSGPTYRYYYAWSHFRVGDIGSWLLILLFLWPLGFLLAELLSRRENKTFWLPLARTLLAAGSIFYLYLNTFLFELWYGGYLAYLALGLYLPASIVELFAIIAARRRSMLRRPSSPSL
jgi:hypothetical protein